MSDHYDGKRFFNPSPSFGKPKGFLEALKWKWSSKRPPWPKIREPKKFPPLKTVGEDEVAITFINHSTVLIRANGLTLLTDPVFSVRVGPFSFLSVERVQPPGLKLEDLPKIDQVLISHNHYDHLDLPSLRAIWERDRPLFIVPLKNGELLKSVGIERIVELDWWESEGNVTLTPAQHWSARGIFDRFKALWGGYWIKLGELKVFYAGDTGYSPHFRQIRDKLGKADIALLPIGAYEPRWFMKDQHLDPEEAVMAHLEVEATKSIGIHFGTFQLADEPFNGPKNDVQKSLLAHNLKPGVFIVPDQGETFTFKNPH